MAVNSVNNNISSYTNTLNDKGQEVIPYHSSADIYIERGGVPYIRTHDGDDETVIPTSIAMKEILPDHPELSLRDIRLDFRQFDKKEYVSIYNRHNNELLKEMPREDFTRKFGKLTANRNHTFELYV